MPQKSATRINSLIYQEIPDRSKDKIIPQSPHPQPSQHSLQNITEPQDWQTVLVEYVKDDFRFIVSVALGLGILFAVFYVFPKVSSELTRVCFSSYFLLLTLLACSGY